MRFLIAFLIACSGSAEPPARSTVASPIATPAAADDVIVAQVNGRPVWGSCVTAQSAGKTKQAALDECVAFELLAQAADARGLSTDPDVTEATRAALVDRLVETGFEQKYRSAADLAAVLSAHVERHKERLSQPEGRASAYVRFPVEKTASPDVDAKARALAERVATKLANEPGLMPPHLEAAAKEIASGEKLEFQNVRMMAKAELVPEYGGALFAITDVGRTAPTAVRTQWGWDVILLTERIPAKTYTREEAAAEAFPEVRRGYFTVWVNQIVRSLGVKITVDQAQVAKLDEGGT